MQLPPRKALALLAVCVVLAGCGMLDRFKDDDKDGSPTSPSSSAVSLDVFAGTWSSAAASTPATGCGNVRYTVTPVSSSSANVMFEATCASSIALTGSGSGKVNGSSLDWTAQGLVSQGGVNCPFTFTNGKATEDATGAIKVVYAGTVCGIPVSGTETVRKGG
ncbi:hypothetical protein BH24ACI5_BH24ACI5_14520 [soil metagenome]